jgi:hypothetical protein
LYFSFFADKVCGRFAYIEMATRDFVGPALMMNGNQFMGQFIVVQQTQAEKNRVATTT